MLWGLGLCRCRTNLCSVAFNSLKVQHTRRRPHCCKPLHACIAAPAPLTVYPVSIAEDIEASTSWKVRTVGCKPQVLNLHLCQPGIRQFQHAKSLGSSLTAAVVRLQRYLFVSFSVRRLTWQVYVQFKHSTEPVYCIKKHLVRWTACMGRCTF